ncbi:hypothetical protein Sjap_012600 [Stephania japonica]|uniref:CCHC-type domain-containing protein n=1 Tax=Stephania japonica TaxID=461633 RepID=A0AAP0IWD5_9MAGN
MVARKGKGKMVKEEREDDEKDPQRSVIFLSSDDEANEDLSLAIVERARLREAKRKRDEDFNGLRSKCSGGEVVVVDLSSTSSEETSGGGGGGVGAEGLAGAPESKRKRRKRKKKKNASEGIGDGEEKTSDVVAPLEQVESVALPVVAAVVKAVESEVVVNPVEEVKTPKLEEAGKETKGVVDNTVMRKLLRGPRYFDSPDCFLETCYNCDEVGHRAANCTAKRRQKPCFVCGSLEHGARNCKEDIECFKCKMKGHRRKDCPEKNQQITKSSKICLRCGNLGHDMFFCSNDYAPEDLKEIKCYMCGKVGHLCCADYADTNLGEISCYTCGQAGHYGLGCASARGETSGTKSVTVSAIVCFRCGEEGHFARGCSQNLKLGHQVGESSVPTKPKKAKKAKNKLGSQSAPVLKKAKKKKNVRLEEKPVTPAKKSKKRGGWITDDPGDPPNRTPKKVNNWRSPATATPPTRSNFVAPVTPPSRTTYVAPNVATDGYNPNSYSWVRTRFQPATPSPYYAVSPNGPVPANPYQYQYQYQSRYSASRFGNGSSGGNHYQYHW